MSRNPKAHFDIDASIVFQLGEDLITDVIQALVELVKNSYDADGDYAKVTVNTSDQVPLKESYFPNARGYVLIEDNGDGMDESTISQGWLTISNSPKRLMKRRNETTKRGRTPLGDKGLGRLGVQRLGGNIEIFTQPKAGGAQYHVGWSWNDFRGDVTLSKVPVRWESLKRRQKAGTQILISDLREPEQWSPSNHERVITSLSQVVSPYAQFRDFDILGTVDGRELELAEISERVRRQARLRYRIKFDEESLQITGRARLDFLRPSNKKDIAAFEQLVEEDGGKRFLDFLLSRKPSSRFGLKAARSGEFFVEFHGSYAFGEIDKLIRPASESIPTSPGPFSAEVDAFNLGTEAVARQSTFDRSAEYKRYIKDLSGVRIYRDGFGVRADRDWLGLGKQQTGGGSFYGLRPENTLGFVSLSAKENAALVETTDREGFKDTPAYRNFLSLFELFVKFSHDAQEFLRRSWLDFRNEHERELAGVEPQATISDIAETMDAGLTRVARAMTSIAGVQDKLDQLQRDSVATFDALDAEAIDTPEVTKAINKARKYLDRQLGDAHAMLKDIAGVLEPAGQLQDLHRVLQGKVESLENKLEQGIEAMSLGLTAEVLSHEIANIVDQLADRTQRINTFVGRLPERHAELIGYIEYVRTTVSGLRRQLGHLAPSLKYARAQRKEIDVAGFCRELKEYHEERWASTPIHLIVVESQSFSVKINQGKLTQVLDNLILNSEYWLKEDLIAGRVDGGKITVRVSGPYIRISDNGYGISPAVEDSLFEPFITTKKKGRGLGLYVAQQLLDSDGCSISLQSRRNAGGRLYQFELDMSGCVIDGNR
ncbi:MAG: sensor histidine kinase [Planctomycetota bacterium]|nr:sensor histidine kinase [Planctomycetota bacterium]